MLKKLLLLLCLASLVAWAAPSKSRKASHKSNKKARVAAEKTVEAPAAPSVENAAVAVSDSAAAAKAALIADDEDEKSVEETTAGMTAAQRKDFFARKKFEEEQRLDEYANSERRRDWLKDRLILEVGLGSRMAFQGENGIGMGIGIGAEYITRWHVGAFASFGFLPKLKDNILEDIDLQGGSGFKVGLNYYFFPKIPVHLGLSASYGTVYYDHDMQPNAEGVREIISVKGFQFDVLISYLTNEWYNLQFALGFYYAPDLAKDRAHNPSFRESIDSKTSTEITYTSRVVGKSNGMDKMGLVIGITIGYAFPEFFPDDTEKRRRQREKERAKADKAH